MTLPCDFRQSRKSSGYWLYATALALGFALNQEASAAVQVYVSYIDNETRAVLTSVLANQNKETVLAIGSGISPGSVFSSNYGGANATSNRTLLPNLNGLSVVQYPAKGMDAEKVAKNIAVVVLPPVNGKNPALMKQYLDNILKALSALPQASAANGGIQVSSFGTAGGVDQDRNPGDIVSVKSSLFVGAIADSSGSYKATIQFSHLGDEARLKVFYSKSFPSKAAAENDAQAMFSKWVKSKSFSQSDLEALEDCPAEKAELLAGFVPWISDVNSALVLSEIQKKQTSVTTSFFAGPEFKNAANEIGLNNVNMEDSHVIDVLNANKIPAEISRVIADPAFLDQEAAAALRDWYASATYSAKQYEEAILWGLSGLDLTRPPDTAKWDVFAKFSPEKARKWIDYHKFQNESAPLDPFYYEIAQNFLDSVQSGTAQRVYLAEVDGKLSANARNILEKEIEKTARKAQEIETQYKKFASGKLPEAELRKSIKGLIESLTYLSVKEEPLRSELLKNSSAKEVDGKAVLNLLAAAKDGDSLKVWKSTSSDYSNITQANDILSGPNPSNESIDRATYIHARTLRLPLAASENTVRELVWLKSK